jgi:polar amino acid transport system ATP-binding protein
MSGPAMIALDKIRKSFGAHEVLREVSLAIAPGEVRVLIGPSGCGKSTLLRCINLLEQPDSGTVTVGAASFRFGAGAAAPRASTVNAFRARLGMVFQQFDLFPHLTALGNVTSGPRIVRRMARRAAEEQGRALLAKVGLADKADAYPRDLSGGQQQRVAIARTLAMDPEVILFDEATSALDPELVGEVLGVMRGLAEEGKTMIIVTHEMAFARDVGHKVSVMDGGVIIEEAPAAELFARAQNPRTRAFLDRFNATHGAPSVQRT